jgi:hypothetical protein
MLEVVRHNIPGGTTVVSTARLEHGALCDRGPRQTHQTDGRAAPVTLEMPLIRFTVTACTDAAGNPVNGTIYLARPGNKRPHARRCLPLHECARIAGTALHGHREVRRVHPDRNAIAMSRWVAGAAVLGWRKPGPGQIRIGGAIPMPFYAPSCLLSIAEVRNRPPTSRAKSKSATSASLRRVR